MGEDRLRRLGLGRSGPAIPLHHQRLAHLSGVGADHRVEPVLGIHVPRRHRVQSRLDEPARVPRQGPRPGRAANLRRRGLRARRPAVDRRARDRGDDGAVPEPRDCAPLLRVPHARPRLRQCRRAADVVRHPLRFGRRPSDLRHADRDPHRHRLRHVSGDGQAAWPLPRLQEESRAHAARDAQSSPRRAWRPPRL